MNSTTDFPASDDAARSPCDIANGLLHAAALWKSRYKEMVKTCAITGKERDNLREQVRLTIMENLHLADGDVCTLRRLKDAIGFDLDSPENATTQTPT